MHRSLGWLSWILVCWFGIFAAVTGDLAPIAYSVPIASAESTLQDAPVIEVPEPAYDFGEIQEGGEVSHVFTVKNTGKTPLQIDQVRPG